MQSPSERQKRAEQREKYDARRDQGLSISNASRAAGVSRQTGSSWERDRVAAAPAVSPTSGAKVPRPARLTEEQILALYEIPDCACAACGQLRDEAVAALTEATWQEDQYSWAVRRLKQETGIDLWAEA